ncbi:hypothetical protein YC2023_100346 [Brassica napus]
MRTFSWSTCSLLTHIAYGDGIWNRWVSSQCKHFQICDKCYEAEQMHEDMESHICLIFKTNSTADSLHADKFAALDPPSLKKMTTIKIRNGKQLMNELQLIGRYVAWSLLNSNDPGSSGRNVLINHHVVDSSADHMTRSVKLLITSLYGSRF